MAATPTKRWGSAEYYGLGYDFDPTFFLTDEERALEEEIIDACERVIRPLAVEADRTGEYPRASIDELGRLRLLAMIAPAEYGCRAASHTQVLMATEAIARYGCPSTAVIGDWTMYADQPDAAPRAAFTCWGLESKVLAAGLAARVSDQMLHLCGGRGYARAAEIERLVRDAKAGWVMAPSNEVSQGIVGRWALLGPDSVDWWNQHVDGRALRNELGKMSAEEKRRLVEELSRELAEPAAG